MLTIPFSIPTQVYLLQRNEFGIHDYYADNVDHVTTDDSKAVTSENGYEIPEAFILKEAVSCLIFANCGGY